MPRERGKRLSYFYRVKQPIPLSIIVAANETNSFSTAKIFNGLYCIDINGVVKNRFGRTIKSFKKKTGYVSIGLNRNGNYYSFLLHRLIAAAFIPNPDNKPCVNHINGIKSDNRIENLEWVTKSENDLHAYKIGLRKANKNRACKLQDNQVKLIREHFARFKNKSLLSREFKVCRKYIKKIIEETDWA